MSVSELLAMPLPAQPDDQEIHLMVPDLRAALDGLDVRVRSADHLAADVSRAQLARMACDYGSLAQLLPTLVAESQVMEQKQQDQRSATLFVRVCVAASLTVRPHGYLDLSARFAERAQASARAVDDPVLCAAADYVAAQTALGGGLPNQRQRSLRLAAGAADRVAGLTSNDSAVWAGMNHLQAALSSVMSNDPGTAQTHLVEATAIARTGPVDSWVQEFSTANVSAWAMAVVLQASDAPRALQALHSIDHGQLRTRQRRARYYGDAARVYHLAGRPQEAITSLLAALQTSPTDVRSRTALRDLGSSLMRSRCRDPRLPGVIQRMGIDPLLAGV
jgi:hypothetical protein